MNKQEIIYYSTLDDNNYGSLNNKLNDLISKNYIIQQVIPTRTKQLAGNYSEVYSATIICIKGE